MRNCTGPISTAQHKSADFHAFRLARIEDSSDGNPETFQAYFTVR